MSITQDTVTLEFGLQRRDRTTSKGVKSRYTIEVSAEPMRFEFNARALGEGPATTIADHLRARVEGIRVLASPSTQKKRIEAERAFNAGKPWAVRRYAGGRTGSMPPNEGAGRLGALFNDSGRLAKSIAARPTSDDTWVINVAANRFDPSTFRDGQAGVQRMHDHLRAHVPEWGDADAIARVPEVREAMALAADQVLVNQLGRAWTKNKRLRADLRRGLFSAVTRGARLLGGF